MLALVLFPLYFAFQRCQLITVAKHLLYQSELKSDNSVLLYYQPGKQSIGDEEKNYEHWKQTLLPLRREIRVSK